MHRAYQGRQHGFHWPVTVVQSNKFPPLAHSVLFAFRVYTREGTPEAALDLGGSGWKAFWEAIEIRNRITHPKTPEGIEITDAEMEVLKDGYAWFLKTYVGKVLDVLEHNMREAGLGHLLKPRPTNVDPCS